MFERNGVFETELFLDKKVYQYTFYIPTPFDFQEIYLHIVILISIFVKYFDVNRLVLLV